MYASEKFRALMSGTRFRAFASEFRRFRALDLLVRSFCASIHNIFTPTHYRGAVAGSLDHVWFGIKYTDGSATGRRGEVEAPAPLISTAEGRAALLR